MRAEFVSPMLAAAMPSAIEELLVSIAALGGWVAEEKWDGHRLCISVWSHASVVAWSRNGKVRELPAHLRTELAHMPDGVYDGELVVPGKRSYGVTVLEDEHLREVRIFDMVRCLGRDTTRMSYDDRRAGLETIFKHRRLQRCLGHKVQLSESWPVTSTQQALALRDEIWARDGEGLVLKLRSSRYEVGKRSKSWRKIKALRSSVLRIVGFREGRLGSQSITVLQDDDGNRTTVKSAGGNITGLAEIESDPERLVGRLLRIEYQERTPDGGYRHPRWDRWADETDR